MGKLVDGVKIALTRSRNLKSLASSKTMDWTLPVFQEGEFVSGVAETALTRS